MDEWCIWLIRHAESTWNAAGRWQGQANPPLSPRGRSQAAKLGDALATQGIEILIASDLARTAQTAALVGRALGLRPRLEAGLRELDAGRWTGLSHDEVARIDAETLAEFRSGDREVRAGSGESRRDVARRARPALRSALSGLSRRRVAVVTHGGVIRSLWPGLSLANAEWRRVDVSGVLAAELP